MAVRSRLDAAVQRVAGTAVFAKVARPVMPALDRASQRLSGGRFLISSLFVPAIVLRTTGAKSGLPRESPLASMPDGDAFYVVGSNWGGEKHPAWTANLLAHPDAEVLFRGRSIPVRAHLLTSEEKVAIWPQLLQVWPTYDTYVERSGRDLRVFRLDRR
jgi:deazaflavin-dependent oxidoreductase (nitroreductase family)